MMKKKKSLLLATMLTFSTISAVSAADVQINNWAELKDNGQNLGNTYILSESVKGSLWSGGEISIGNSSAEAGSWNLNGNNVELYNNYNNAKLSIQSNINSFVFENLNVKELKDAGGLGSALFNRGGGIQVVS